MDDQEREIRNRLVDQLGVEFCEPEEVDKEIGKAVDALPPDPEPEPEIGGVHATSVNDIIRQCREMHAKLGKGNAKRVKANRPVRNLLFLCAVGLHQLQQRLMAADNEITKLKGGTVQ